jgi:hypothetical protein
MLGGRERAVESLRKRTVICGLAPFSRACCGVLMEMGVPFREMRINRGEKIGWKGVEAQVSGVVQNLLIRDEREYIYSSYSTRKLCYFRVVG